MFNSKERGLNFIPMPVKFRVIDDAAAVLSLP